MINPKVQDALDAKACWIDGPSEKEIEMLPYSPSSLAGYPSLPLECSEPMSSVKALSMTPLSTAVIVPLPRFNASYSVVFIRDGAKKRRDLAYARARELQRELGVVGGLQCVPSLP
jgi:hypothetical protein